MKKIISLILIFILCCSYSFIPTYGEDKNEGMETYEYSFLKQIGILDQKLSPQQAITKGDFVVFALNLLYPNTNFKRSTLQEDAPFLDVDNNHKYYAQIKAAKDLKIINGDLNQKFYPEKIITPLEATVILIHGLGYAPYVSSYGGYPTGYLTIAREIGIQKGINYSKEELSFHDAVKLIYQSLFADLVVFEGTSNGEIIIKRDDNDNLLSNQFNIDSYDVRVVDNGITSLVGESIKDQSKILFQDMDTGNLFQVDSKNSDLSHDLGMRATAYIYEGDGKTELVFFKLNPKSKEFKLFGDQILTVNQTYLEYEEGSFDYQSKKINFEGISPILIFNGTILNQYPLTLLKPQDGIVRLVDYDGNGKVELVEIINFNYTGNMEELAKAPRNIVVDSYNKETEFLICKFNPVNSLDLGSDVSEYKIVSNKIKTIDEVKQNQIISIAKCPEQRNGKDFYLLYISDETVSGKVEWISANTNEVQLADKIYKLSGSIVEKTGYMNRLKNQTNIKVSLDVLGKISYIDQSSYRNRNYAYLIHAGIKNQGDETLLIKVYTKENNIQTLEVSEKAIIDGNKAVPKTGQSLAARQLELIAKRPEELKRPSGAPGETEYLSRPILLETSENLVTRIETDNPNHPTDKTAINIYKDQTPIAYSDEELNDDNTLKAAYRSARNSFVNMNVYTVDGRFYINSETLIINVPDIDPNGLANLSGILTDGSTQAIDYRMVQLCERSLEDKNYRFMNVNEFNNRFRYDIQAYDIDEDTGVASLIVVRGRTDIYTYGLVPPTSDVKLLVYLSMSEVYNEYLDKTVKKIYYTSDGQSISSCLVDQDDLYFPYKLLLFGGKSPFDKEVTALKKGDIIRVIKNGDWLSHIERVYAIDNISDYDSSTIFPSNIQNIYHTALHTSVPMPFDRRKYWQPLGVNEAYSLGTIYVKSISGKRLNSIIGNPNPESVDLDDINTYIQTFYDVSNAQIMVIDIDKSGEVKTKSGQLNDIITLDQTDGVIENASMVIFRHRYYRFETLIIINDQRLYV